MKKFSCRSLGLNCDFSVLGQTDDEVLEHAVDHIETDHPSLIDEDEENVEDKVVANITEV